MKVRLLSTIGTPLPQTTPLGHEIAKAGGSVREVAVFEGIIDDYRFPPDIITLNGQQAFKYAYNINEGGVTVSVYCHAISHNIALEAKGAGADVSSPH